MSWDKNTLNTYKRQGVNIQNIFSTLGNKWQKPVEKLTIDMNGQVTGKKNTTNKKMVNLISYLESAN